MPRRRTCGSDLPATLSPRFRSVCAQKRSREQQCSSSCGVDDDALVRVCACSGRAASLLSSGVPAQCLHSLSHSHSHSLAHLLAQSNMQSINQPFSQSMVRPKTHGGLGRRTKRLVPPLERTSSWHSPRKLALQVDPRYAPFPASSSKPNTFHHSLYREKPAARIALRVWTQLH
eukprot:1220062-Rhodomonas_salina.2